MNRILNIRAISESLRHTPSLPLTQLYPNPSVKMHEILYEPKVGSCERINKRLIDVIIRTNISQS